MSEDYFRKAGKRTQPVRDLFNRPASAPKVATVPKAPSAPKMAEVGKLQGESLEDFTYMRSAQDRINRKLAPKSVMGKSSPKR